MKVLRCLILVSTMLAACVTVLAGIRPSFRPEQSCWRATDIVVVTEGKEIDGVVQVIETWKGELKPGSTLTIPELAEFQAKEARLVDNRWSEGRQTSVFVTGDRMILFLKDQTKSLANTEADDEENETAETEENRPRWSGANSMGSEVKYSTVWIEGDKAYCFIQLLNPGPSLLCSAPMNSADLRKLNDDVMREQIAFNAAAAMTDPVTRAECLRPFIHSSIYLARNAAFENLIKCGPAALPVLREELNNNQDGNIQADVVDALAKSGGKAAGPDLTAFLSKELEYWRRTAPTLKPGWWNGEGFGTEQMDAIKAVEPFRDRWGALLQTIYALREIRYAESAELVAALSDLWRSLPQMAADQVGEACDDFFRTLGLNSPGTRRLRLPQYEVHFRGNRAFSSQELEWRFAEYVAQYDRLDKDYESELPGGVFDYAVHQLGASLWNQGYLDADFKTGRGATTRGQIITVNIEEGKRYRIGEIRIEGAKVFSAERIRAMFPLRTGDIANSELIDKWENELEESYHNLGYLDCSLDLQHKSRSNSKETDTAIADFKLAIADGPQFVVEIVRFLGKRTVPDDQLVSAMSLRSGDKFNFDSLNAGIKELNQRFGLRLDPEGDVELSTNHRSGRVTVKIFLDQDRPPKKFFSRWKMRRNWYE